MLMWLMREAKGVERSVEGLARRMLLVYVASIHTTSLVRNITSSSVDLIIYGADVYATIVPPSRKSGIY